MFIKSTSSVGNFEIENHEGINILELSYTNWFSSKATTILDSTNIEIKPKNIWASKFDILKNGIDKGDITFNWKGNIIIRLENDENQENEYLLRVTGFWNSGFELIDKNDIKILSMKPNFNWKKISYNYEVEHTSNTDEHTLTELLIYCGFGANLYMTMMMAG